MARAGRVCGPFGGHSGASRGEQLPPPPVHSRSMAARRPIKMETLVGDLLQTGRRLGSARSIVGADQAL